MNVLVLGGTTEASALARLLADRGVVSTLSYAGRTANPRVPPIAVRIGGFGGVEGLVDYLRQTRVTHLVDASHPFAATISANAVAAAAIATVPLIALTRPAWRPTAEDRWNLVADVDSALTALACPPKRVLLALGRMHIEAFAAQPQHHYLLRFVDRPAAPPTLPRHRLVLDRGPFSIEGDRALMQTHAIEMVVSKNSGGSGAEAKLIAARELGLPVLMIERPVLPERTEAFDPAEVLSWLGHGSAPGVERGV